MIKLALVISLLMIVRSSSVDGGSKTKNLGRLLAEERHGEFIKIHSNLFKADADKQSIEETMRQLKWVRDYLEGQESALFRKKNDPNFLISLFTNEKTCNVYRSEEISETINYHLREFGHNNLVEYLKVARHNQLAGCQFEEIKSKYDKAIADLSKDSKKELPKLMKFIEGLDDGTKEILKHKERLDKDQVADLVVAYLRIPSKGSRFTLKSTESAVNIESIRNAIRLMKDIGYDYIFGFGRFGEISKDPSIWNRLDDGMKSNILVGRFCALVKNTPYHLDELVSEKWFAL